jgi:hypothetical protein
MTTEYDDTLEEEDPVGEPDWAASLRQTNKTIKARNKELAAQVEELEARLAVSEPLARSGLIQTAGFSPDGPAGKLLAKALADGEVEADPTLMIEYARGYGIRTTDREAYWLDAANRQTALHTVTESITTNDVGRNIQEAESAGDWDTSRRLKTAALAAQLKTQGA